MFKYFLYENTKIKRTFIKKLMWLAPILVIIFSFINPFTFQANVYNWWCVLMFPGTLSLGCALLNRIDGYMKNRAIIALPLELKKVWIAKVLIGVKNISFSCIIIFVAAQLGAFVFPIDDGSRIPVLNGLAGIIILIITCMWQVPLWMFLESKIDMFPTIILSVAVNFFFGVVWSIEKYWWMIPFAYKDRLMCPVLKILPNGLPAKPGNQTFTPELLNTSAIPLGIGVSIVLFLIVTYLTAKWYERQEAV